MKKLEQLPEIAARQLGGLEATPALLAKIKLKAAEERTPRKPAWKSVAALATAFVLLAVVFFKRLRHIKRHTLVRGAIMGALFFLMLSTELTGLKSYPAGLTMTAARRVTDRFCQSAIQLVLDTDLAMKTSAGEQEQLLELLLVRLALEAQHG